MNDDADLLESERARRLGWRTAVVAPFPERVLMLKVEQSRRRRLRGALAGAVVAVIATAVFVATLTSAIQDDSVSDGGNTVAAAEEPDQRIATGNVGEWMTVTFPGIDVRPIAGGLWRVGADGSADPLYQIIFFEEERDNVVAHRPWDQQLPIADVGVASNRAIVLLPTARPSGEYSICLGFDQVQCIPIQVSE